MRVFWLLLTVNFAVFTQSPESGHIERRGDRATLTVDNARPLDSAAITLAEQYGLAVSVEDPPYLFANDLKDVTAQVSRVPNPPRRVFVPKGGKLEVEFVLGTDGAPQDTRGLLQDLVNQANLKFSFGYRLDESGGRFTLIPTRTRDAAGRVIEITPLMDRRVTIPLGTRSIAETAQIMSAELSVQTGLRVSCCQSLVAGIPWGMKSVTFEARNEPARDVLHRLIAEDLDGRPIGYYWLQRSDSQWCFINLFFTSRSTVQTQTALPSVGTGQLKWFDATPRVPASAR